MGAVRESTKAGHVQKLVNGYLATGYPAIVGTETRVCHHVRCRRENRIACARTDRGSNHARTRYLRPTHAAT